MLGRPDRFWLGVFSGVAASLIAIAVIAPLADVLARRDVINAQSACRRAGGDVLLSDDGTWRCVLAVEGRMRIRNNSHIHSSKALVARSQSGTFVQRANPEQRVAARRGGAR